MHVTGVPGLSTWARGQSGGEGRGGEEREGGWQRGGRVSGEKLNTDHSWDKRCGVGGCQCSVAY